MLYTPQRNSLFELVAKSSLSHNLFEEQKDTDAYILKVVGTEWAYKIIRAPTAVTRPYGVSFFPGWKSPFELTIIKETTWDKVLAYFERWLSIVEGELSAPDLWAEAAKTAQLFAPTSTPTDDKFTRTELAEVQSQLRLMQLSFTQAALPEAAKQKLIELTQTAAVKAEGLTKKDWQNWIIGGFISAITGLALNPTQASEVLKLVKAAFGGLFLH